MTFILADFSLLLLMDQNMLSHIHTRAREYVQAVPLTDLLGQPEVFGRRYTLKEKESISMNSEARRHLTHKVRRHGTTLIYRLNRVEKAVRYVTDSTVNQERETERWHQYMRKPKRE